MYSINTLLAHFKYHGSSYPLLANVTWYRMDRNSMQSYAFTREEADAFMDFSSQHVIHFPGQRFLQQTDHFNAAVRFGANAKEGSPIYLILSKSPLFKQDSPTAGIFDIVLVDPELTIPVDFTLDFDVIGKIEVYRKFFETS